jgi:hypothetical protein
MFLVEVIAHDIRFMIEKAFQVNSIAHDKLLQIFLTIDDASNGDPLKAYEVSR